MNREIKFRAWGRSKMLFSEKGDFYLNANGNVSIPSSTGHEFYDREYPIMQFTGLTDKNGKEIYEGDIVKWYNGSMMPPNTDEANKYFQAIHGNEDFEKPNYDVWDKVYSIKPVVFENGCFKPKDNNPFFSAHLSPSQIEIIGNIFSNPELLNP